MGSIPDCVIGIFHLHNPSGRTMALGSTQPLREMSIRNIFWAIKMPVCRADKLPTSCANFLEIWKPRPPENLWACNRPEHGSFYLLVQIIKLLVM